MEEEVKKLLREYLKDNLSIHLEWKEGEYGDSFPLEVSLLLEGKTISKSTVEVAAF